MSGSKTTCPACKGTGHIADAWISHSTARARKPSRPGVSVGNPQIYAAVAAELRACANELDFLGDWGGAAHLRDRANQIENGDTLDGCPAGFTPHPRGSNPEGCAMCHEYVNGNV